MGFYIEEETAATPTGFYIEEDTPQPTTARDYLMGGLKGIAKAGTDVALAPADLLFRGGNYLLDAVTGSETNLEGSYPTDVMGSVLEKVSGGEGNKTAENVTRTVGNVASIFASPIRTVQTLKSVPQVAKLIQGGATLPQKAAGLVASGVGTGAEGALYSALMDTKADDIGQNMGVGAATNIGVASLLKAAGKGIKAISNRFDDGAAAVREQGMGVMAGDRSRGLKNLPQYLDDSGNVVDKASATTVSAPIEEQIALLTRKGILQAAPNAPRELQAFLGTKAVEAGDDVGKLISEADQVLGPQTLPVPFNETAKFFEQLGKQNPAKATELADDFARVVENYNNAGAGVNPVTGQAAQSSVGALSRINAIKAGTKADVPMWQTAGDKPRVELYRAMYRDLQKFEDDVFNATLPSKAGLFKEAKDLYGALQAVGTTITKAGSRKAPTLGNALEGGSKLPATIFAATTPILGPGGATVATGAYMVGRGGKNLVQNAYPMTVANLYDKASSATGGISNLLGGMTQAAPAASAGIATAGAERETPSSGMIPAQQAEPTPEPQAQASDLDQRYSEAINRALSSLTDGGKMEDTKPQVEDVQLDRAPAGSAAEDLVQAVVMQESSNKKNPKGDPNAVSPKGAQGLMQLMPATGREWHKKLGIKEPYDPFDPEQNKTIGTAYLNYLLDMYDGDEELALTAYNQGFGRVNKLLARTKGKTLDDIIEFLGPDGQGYARGVLSKLDRLRKNGQVMA